MELKNSPSRRPKIGLALSSGGARGGVHLGVLHVLQKEGIPIDALSGSSAGAIVAGCYVCQTLDKLEKFLARISRREVIKLFDPHFSRESLVKGEKTIELLQFLTDNKDFKDLNTQIFIMASDIKSGQEVVLNKGKVANALFASMCAPPLFKPVNFNGMRLVDGGLIHLLPVEILKRNGCDIVIGSSLKTKKLFSLEKGSRTIKTYKIVRENFKKTFIIEKISLLKKMYDDIFSSDNENRSLTSADRYTFVRSILDCLDIGIESPEREEKLADIVIKTDVNGIKTIDLHRATECIKRGEEEMNQRINEVKCIIGMNL